MACARTFENGQIHTKHFAQYLRWSVLVTQMSKAKFITTTAVSCSESISSEYPLVLTWDAFAINGIP
jgi:hypothetical protein